MIGVIAGLVAAVAAGSVDLELQLGQCGGLGLSTESVEEGVCTTLNVVGTDVFLSAVIRSGFAEVTLYETDACGSGDVYEVPCGACEVIPNSESGVGLDLGLAATCFDDPQSDVPVADDDDDIVDQTRVPVADDDDDIVDQTRVPVADDDDDIVDQTRVPVADDDDDIVDQTRVPVGDDDDDIVDQTRVPVADDDDDIVDQTRVPVADDDDDVVEPSEAPEDDDDDVDEDSLPEQVQVVLFVDDECSVPIETIDVAVVSGLICMEDPTGDVNPLYLGYVMAQFDGETALVSTHASADCSDEPGEAFALACGECVAAESEYGTFGARMDCDVEYEPDEDSVELGISAGSGCVLELANVEVPSIEGYMCVEDPTELGLGFLLVSYDGEVAHVSTYSDNACSGDADESIDVPCGECADLEGVASFVLSCPDVVVEDDDDDDDVVEDDDDDVVIEDDDDDVNEEDDDDVDEEDDDDVDEEDDDDVDEEEDDDDVDEEEDDDDDSSPADDDDDEVDTTNPDEDDDDDDDDDDDNADDGSLGGEDDGNDLENSLSGASTQHASLVLVAALVAALM